MMVPMSADRIVRLRSSVFFNAYRALTDSIIALEGLIVRFIFCYTVYSVRIGMGEGLAFYDGLRE